MKLEKIVTHGIKVAGFAIAAGTIAGSIVSPRMRREAFLLQEEEPVPAEPGRTQRVLVATCDTLLLFGPIRRLLGMDLDWPE